MTTHIYLHAQKHAFRIKLLASITCQLKTMNQRQSSCFTISRQFWYINKETQSVFMQCVGFLFWQLDILPCRFQYGMSEYVFVSPIYLSWCYMLIVYESSSRISIMLFCVLTVFPTLWFVWYPRYNEYNLSPPLCRGNITSTLQYHVYGFHKIIVLSILAFCLAVLCVLLAHRIVVIMCLFYKCFSYILYTQCM